MKTFNQFINESYYNSHGNYSTFAEIRDIEVDERDNYPMEMFNEWQEKYNIKDDDKVIWVTNNKKRAYSYLLPPDYYDSILNMSDRQIKKALSREGYDDSISEINEKDGFIIPESDDGDNGFLFVKK